MTKIKNGGPAFPCPEVRLDDRTGVVQACDGMSLRDWFAGQALVHIANWTPNCDHSDTKSFQKAKAEYAYGLADAMLAAREAEP